MADVTPREWRLKGLEIRHEHTTEVKTQELPEEVKTLLLEMADEINRLKVEVHSQRQELDALQRVSLNDLIRKSA